MLNTFQLHIPRVAAGVLIGGAVIGLSAIYGSKLFNRNPVRNYSSQNDYEKDVRLLFQIAQRLGYTEDNQLNFFRIEANNATSEDKTKLVFSSSDSPESFSQKVDRLGLKPDTYAISLHGKQRKDNQYIGFINKPRDLSIVLTDIRSESDIGILPDEITPLVTMWNFVLSQTPERTVFLRIHFAQLSKTDLSWIDKRNGKTIPGPLVVMSLSRS
jgi:hypothetical protein